MPEGVPARRAVLAGAVETAVNVLWDAAPLVGDRITVIGAGMIGCARRAPALAESRASTSCVVDVDRSKAARVRCARRPTTRIPRTAPLDRDLVIETSGSEEGLQFALESAATEGEIIEASWFGDRPVQSARWAATSTRGA